MPGPACTQNTFYLNQESCRVWGVLLSPGPRDSLSLVSAGVTWPPLLGCLKVPLRRYRGSAAVAAWPSGSSTALRQQ